MTDLPVFRVRNWSKFQHFRDRRPPWVKLYRDLLDDPEWHTLHADVARFLVNLWLIASEDEQKTGTLPDINKISWRLHLDKTLVKQWLESLIPNWIETDDIDAISARYQSDINLSQKSPPEGEGEGEGERETDNLRKKRRIKAKRRATNGADDATFDLWWQSWPKKVAKLAARKAWAKLTPEDREVATTALATWKFNDNPQYIHDPATWLNQHRWDDEPPAGPDPSRVPDWNAHRDDRVVEVASFFKISLAGKDRDEVAAKLGGYFQRASVDEQQHVWNLLRGTPSEPPQTDDGSWLLGGKS